MSVNLQTIPSNGRYGVGINGINTNFLTIQTAINMLQQVASHQKGYYATIAALRAAVPNPQEGDWAVIPDTSDPTKAYVWNYNGSDWVIGVQFTGTIVDSLPYATETELAALQALVESNALVAEGAVEDEATARDAAILAERSRAEGVETGIKNILLASINWSDLSTMDVAGLCVAGGPTMYAVTKSFSGTAVVIGWLQSVVSGNGAKVTQRLITTCPLSNGTIDVDTTSSTIHVYTRECAVNSNTWASYTSFAGDGSTLSGSDYYSKSEVDELISGLEEQIPQSVTQAGVQQEVSSQITSLTAQMRADFGADAQDISNLQTAVSNISSSIGTINGTLSTHGTNISNLQTAVGNLPTKTYVDTADQSVLATVSETYATKAELEEIENNSGHQTEPMN